MSRIERMYITPTIRLLQALLNKFLVHFWGRYSWEGKHLLPLHFSSKVKKISEGLFPQIQQQEQEQRFRPFIWKDQRWHESVVRIKWDWLYVWNSCRSWTSRVQNSLAPNSHIRIDGETKKNPVPVPYPAVLGWSLLFFLLGASNRFSMEGFKLNQVQFTQENL